MTREQRRARRAEREAQQERIRQAQQETARIVASGRCPLCGSALRRNLALGGWWQCEQFGAPDRRARPEDAQCSWQGFTE